MPISRHPMVRTATFRRSVEKMTTSWRSSVVKIADVRHPREKWPRPSLVWNGYRKMAVRHPMEKNDGLPSPFLGKMAVSGLRMIIHSLWLGQTALDRTISKKTPLTCNSQNINDFLVSDCISRYSDEKNFSPVPVPRLFFPLSKPDSWRE